MSNLKLAVEVVRAHNLKSKDERGLSNLYVELRFDNQIHQTSTKQKDLDHCWNETFYFDVSNPNNLPNLTLEAYIYSRNNTKNSNSLLGKVRINGTSFVAYSDAVVCNYPLEKGKLFSSVTGELGLKVYITDDSYIKSSNPIRETSSSSSSYSSLHTVRSDFVSQKPNEPISDLLNNKGKRIKSPQKYRNLSNSNYQNREASSSSSGSSSSFSSSSHQTVNNRFDDATVQSQLPKSDHFYSSSYGQPSDFTLKDTSPFLGSERPKKQSRVHDLVETMQYLFVRVVKARDLPAKDLTGGLNPYVEVKLGNYKGVTHHFEKTHNPEWNIVFTFSKDNIQSSGLEVVVKDKDTLSRDDFVGIVRFDLHEIPMRVLPDSPLAPEWYRLEDKKGVKTTKGELMLCVWFGTQADETFNDAWHSDTATTIQQTYLRSKVYQSPRLWYVRVHVIEVQDLVLTNRNRLPYIHVKVQIGNQVLRTKPVQSQNMNAMWNEELMFVASEPFDENLCFYVEDRVAPGTDESFGKVFIPLSRIEKRADDRIVPSRWFNLQKPSSANDVKKERKNENRFASKIHLRVCLDGGYHVLEEPIHYSTDLRPTIRQLWKEPIGMLELGLLRADGIAPMKMRNGRATSDTFCVAKYGQKWVRTRTILDSLNPKYNELYTWDVYDPATVISIGVFDNGHIGDNERSSSSSNNNKKDRTIGKVRIRLSTLEAGRAYTHAYPLIVLHPSGVKKMGDLHLAIRFTCNSKINMMYLYSKPLLPKMHYIKPLSTLQLDFLRHHAVNIISARLSRAEPPLKKEVIGYVTDSDSHLWSMRRSKANFFRLMTILNGFIIFAKWFNEVRMWKNPVVTVIIHVLFLLLALFPELILPTLFVYGVLIGLWNYRFRPKYPPHMNLKLSHAENLHIDELDEEFDTFPTSRNPEVVRMRYDRLRSIASRIQTVVGDLASQGERVHALLSWRDPRATFLFMGFCVLAAVICYCVSLQFLIVMAGLYVMRHPRVRRRGSPSFVMNFFRRLPARTDCIL